MMKKISLLILGSVVIMLGIWRFFPFARSVDTYAQSMLKQCQNTPYRPACYEKEIPKLMDHISMEDAFAVTKRVQDRDPQFAYCHVVAHALTAQEAKKDPASWKDVLLRCPMAMCNYGCLHGSLIARFRGELLTDEQIEVLVLDIMDVCEPRSGFSPTGIEQTMCYHGIGHLAMYMTDGAPEKAIPICERIATRNDGRDYTKTCVEGVFMTVFQSIDPEDLALVIDIKPTKSEVERFCAIYGAYWTHCRRESFPLFLTDAESPEGLMNFCSYALDMESKKDCYGAVINVMTDKAFEKPDGMQAIEAYCGNLPREVRGWCYDFAAMRLVQVDPIRNISFADGVCALNTTQMDREACYKDLVYYSKFSFSIESVQFVSYCQALSVPWRDECLSQK